MIEAHKFSFITKTVNNTFEKLPISGVCFDSIDSVAQNKMVEINSKIKKHTIIGVLFCQPHTKFVQAEILNSLNYLHHRSGENINFFCCGYGAYFPPEEENLVTTIDNVKWSYSDKYFVQVIKEFEKLTKWEYSGETDFLLLDVIPSYNPDTLNIKNAVVCNLEQMQKDGAFSSVRKFFEDMIRLFSNPEKRNTLAYSDMNTINIGKDFLIDTVIENLPIKVNKLYKKCKEAKHFVIKDITK